MSALAFYNLHLSKQFARIFKLLINLCTYVLYRVLTMDSHKSKTSNIVAFACMIFGVETIFTIKLLYARKLCTFWCFHPNYQYFNQSIWVTLYICWNILRHYYSWKLSFVLIMFQKPEYLRHNWTRVFVVKQKKR